MPFRRRERGLKKGSEVSVATVPPGVQAKGQILALALSPDSDKKCERQDLNLHGLPHWILNPARLPIPPLSQIV